MSIFKEFATIVYDAYDEIARWEDKLYEYNKHQEEIGKQERIQKKRIKEQLERKKHEQYREQYFEDPISIMICPFGWSPFGIYL